MHKPLLTLLASLLVLSFPTASAAYPERPVQFVVPWPPGDLEDVLTRLIAEELQDDTGVPTAVVNRPGGGGVVGASAVAQAKPDGYTVGSFVIGIPTVHVLMGNAPYDRETFEPVGIFLTYPFVLAARKDAPYDDLATLSIYAQENDVKLGHFGYGLVPTRVTVLALEELGASFSSNAAFDALDCTTLASGDADVINTTIQLVLPCLDELKILAAYTGERISILPDVLTVGEQVSGMDTTLWNGLFVPAGTPQEVKNKLAEVAQRALTSEAAQEVAETTGAVIYWQDAETATARIDTDYEALQQMLIHMGDLEPDATPDTTPDTTSE